MWAFPFIGNMAAAARIVANSGIFGDIGEFINAIHAQEVLKIRESTNKKGNLAKSGTKKIMPGRAYIRGKCAKMRVKKVLCNTIHAPAGMLNVEKC
uniref:Uncharacterized protein n=1 Tax=uncultured prokaryote TaxID=198431 RepID=A0A0H5Q6A2_9ZZZZ|nr:hypothetical protein [uncultured prokaryote]